MLSTSKVIWQFYLLNSLLFYLIFILTVSVTVLKIRLCFAYLKYSLSYLRNEGLILLDGEQLLLF